MNEHFSRVSWTLEFADLVQELRRRSGQSVSDFAVAIGAGRDEIENWESGLRLPPKQFLTRLLDLWHLQGNIWEQGATADHLLGILEKEQKRTDQREEVIAVTTRELMYRLASEPNSLFDLSPRKFEEVIAELLISMGATITLTPQTRDGGRDIFAVFPSQFGQILTIVECKRYARDRKVGTPILERFLWTINDRDKATIGLVAITSSFSADAMALAQMYQWKLKLADFENLAGWLKSYGDWIKRPGSNLWIAR